MVVKPVLPCQECLCSYHPVISHLSKWQTWWLPARKQEIWPARPEQCDWDKHTPPCLTTWTTALVMCLRACFSTWPVAMDSSASRQPSINPVSGQTDRQRHSLCQEIQWLTLYTQKQRPDNRTDTRTLIYPHTAVLQNWPKVSEWLGKSGCGCTTQTRWGQTFCTKGHEGSSVDTITPRSNTYIAHTHVHSDNCRPKTLSLVPWLKTLCLKTPKSNLKQVFQLKFFMDGTF